MPSNSYHNHTLFKNAPHKHLLKIAQLLLGLLATLSRNVVFVVFGVIDSANLCVSLNDRSNQGAHLRFEATGNISRVLADLALALLAIESVFTTE